MKKNISHHIPIFPKSVAFVGIGGIGVSALSALAIHEGARVFGVDLVKSDLTSSLAKKGATIAIGQDASIDLENQGIRLLIYSPAVPENHVLRKNAKSLGIREKSYPEMLGVISRQYFTIAVSGMHGKSTTTAMIGILLESADLDPLVIVGTKVPQWEKNIRIPKNTQAVTNMNQGSGKTSRAPLFVVEADEYKGAMLQLRPNCIVLTRVEEDHLDYYKDITHIKEEFKRYVKNLAKDGVLVVNQQDTNSMDIAQAADTKNTTIEYNTQEDLQTRTQIKEVLKISGMHNVENALAAYQVGKLLGLTDKKIIHGLSQFKGTWRRMEKLGKIKNEIPLISDYGHHPTELKATLGALKEEYPNKRLVLAYQPHQHNRTKTLFDRFVSAFSDADVLILNEIYDVAGRKEGHDAHVSSKDLAEAIEKKEKNSSKTQSPQEIYYTPTLKATKEKILETIKPNDVLIIMGAGDIDSVARELVS